MSSLIRPLALFSLIIMALTAGCGLKSKLVTQGLAGKDRVRGIRNGYFAPGTSDPRDKTRTSGFLVNQYTPDGRYYPHQTCSAVTLCRSTQDELVVLTAGHCRIFTGGYYSTDDTFDPSHSSVSRRADIIRWWDLPMPQFDAWVETEKAKGNSRYAETLRVMKAKIVSYPTDEGTAGAFPYNDRIVQSTASGSLNVFGYGITPFPSVSRRTATFNVIGPTLGGEMVAVRGQPTPNGSVPAICPGDSGGHGQDANGNLASIQSGIDVAPGTGPSDQQRCENSTTAYMINLAHFRAQVIQYANVLVPNCVDPGGPALVTLNVSGPGRGAVLDREREAVGCHPEVSTNGCYGEATIPIMTSIQGITARATADPNAYVSEIKIDGQVVFSGNPASSSKDFLHLLSPNGKADIDVTFQPKPGYRALPPVEITCASTYSSSSRYFYGVVKAGIREANGNIRAASMRDVCVYTTELTFNGQRGTAIKYFDPGVLAPNESVVIQLKRGAYFPDEGQIIIAPENLMPNEIFWTTTLSERGFSLEAQIDVNELNAENGKIPVTAAVKLDRWDTIKVDQPVQMEVRGVGAAYVSVDRGPNQMIGCQIPYGARRCENGLTPAIHPGELKFTLVANPGAKMRLATATVNGAPMGNNYIATASATPLIFRVVFEPIQGFELAAPISVTCGSVDAPSDRFWAMLRGHVADASGALAQSAWLCYQNSPNPLIQVWDPAAVPIGAVIALELSYLQPFVEFSATRSLPLGTWRTGENATYKLTWTTEAAPDSAAAWTQPKGMDQQQQQQTSEQLPSTESISRAATGRDL